MNQIKGLAKITNLSQDVQDKLEQAAVLHRRHSRLDFKILEATKKEITIQVVQGKSPTEKYFDTKRLVEIVHETFDRFFPGQKVIVRPITYSASPVDVVTVAWINERMLDTGTTLKKLAEETGLNKSHISNILNDGMPLSSVMKAVFFYYFKSKSE